MSDAVVPSIVLSLVVILFGFIIVKCWLQNRYMKRRIDYYIAVLDTVKQHVDVALLSEIHSHLQESTHDEGTGRHPDKSDNSPEIEMVEMERPHCSTHPDELSSIERIHVQPTNPLPESSTDELPSPRQGLQQTLQRTSDYLQMTLRPQPQQQQQQQQQQQHSSLYTPLMWLKSEHKKWKDRLENSLYAKRITDNRFEIRENDESSTFDGSEDQPTTTVTRPEQLLRTVPRGTEEQFEVVRSHQTAAMHHSEMPATMDVVKYETSSDQRQQKQPSMLTGTSLEELAKTIHTAAEEDSGRRDLRQGQGQGQGQGRLKDDVGELEKKQGGCSLNIQQTTRERDHRRRNRTKSADQVSDLQCAAESEDTAPDLEYVNVEYGGRGRRGRGKDEKSSKYVNVSLR